MSKFICGGNEYEIVNDTIFRPVSFKNLPEEIKVQEETLHLVNSPDVSFHVSLVYIKRIIDRYGITIPDFKDKIVNDFCDFIKENDIDVTSYKNEYRFCSRDGIKKTVVAMCEVSNLNKFFDLINKKYNLNIKYPTPHITLYSTIKDQPGIFLMDEDDIKNFTLPIENPIGYSLTN